MNYTEEQIRLIINNVAVNNDGFEFLYILLEKLGAFDRGMNFQNHDIEIYNKAKREQGLWLLDLLMISNFNKYSEIMKRRKDELCKKNQPIQN